MPINQFSPLQEKVAQILHNNLTQAEQDIIADEFSEDMWDAIFERMGDLSDDEDDEGVDYE